MMFIQILLVGVLVAVVSIALTKSVVEELGGDGPATKLGIGLTQVVLGFFIFQISGEDMTLLEWRLDEFEIMYFVVRYAFLLDALFGLVQVFTALFAKVEQGAGIKENYESVPETVTTPAQSQNGYRTTAAPTEHIPAWKRVQMEQEND